MVSYHSPSPNFLELILSNLNLDHTHLAVWLLDGDPSHSNLLKYALTEHTFPDTLVILTVSMTTPWAMLDQLREWASLLQDHIDKLPLSAEAIREYQHKCKLLTKFFLLYVAVWLNFSLSDSRRWQEYVEPGDELEAAQLRRTSRHVESEEENNEHLFPLPEGVLTRNLGLDIVVVVTKVMFHSSYWCLFLNQFPVTYVDGLYGDFGKRSGLQRRTLRFHSAALAQILPTIWGCTILHFR